MNIVTEESSHGSLLHARFTQRGLQPWHYLYNTKFNTTDYYRTEESSHGALLHARCTRRGLQPQHYLYNTKFNTTDYYSTEESSHGTLLHAHSHNAAYGRGIIYIILNSTLRTTTAQKNLVTVPYPMHDSHNAAYGRGIIFIILNSNALRSTTAQKNSHGSEVSNL